MSWRDASFPYRKFGSWRKTVGSKSRVKNDPRFASGRLTESPVVDGAIYAPRARALRFANERIARGTAPDRVFGEAPSHRLSRHSYPLELCFLMGFSVFSAHDCVKRSRISIRLKNITTMTSKWIFAEQQRILWCIPLATGSFASRKARARGA